MHSDSLRFYCVVLCTTFVLGAPTSAAQAADAPPLIRTAEVSESDFAALARAKGFQPYSLAAEDELLDRALSKKLRDLVNQGQAAWLSGSLETARSVFERIADLALSADWRPAQREAVHYVLLRRAQIAASPIEQEAWLEKAVAFGSDLEPEPGIFPPPITAAYNTARARLFESAFTFAAGEKLAPYKQFKLNGKPYEVTSDLRIKLPKGTYRLTAVSDTYETLAVTADTARMISLFAASTPLARGTCASPELESSLSAQKKIVSVLYANDCVRTFDGHSWLPRISEVDLSVLSHTRESDAAGNGLFSDLENRLSPQTAPSIVRRKQWLWLGVTALAAGAVYAIYQSQNHGSSQSVQPVQREGF